MEIRAFIAAGMAVAVIVALGLMLSCGEPQAETQCSANADCADSPVGPVCDSTTGECVLCVEAGHCPPGQRCVAHFCEQECADAEDCAAGHGCCGGVCIDLSTNMSHCGGCDESCSIPNGTAECVRGSCQVESCDEGWADCNGDSATCEVDLQSDPLHCGACDDDCHDLLPHAEVDCLQGRCEMTGCEFGFWDLDGDPSTGCEYACEVTQGVDLPDEDFADTNCDGIDGTVSSAVFVAEDGSDSAPGTLEEPVATISRAIAVAVQEQKSHVYISNGTYLGAVELATGVSLFGGYSRALGWQRSDEHVVVLSSGEPSGEDSIAVHGVDITSPTTIDRIVIVAEDATEGSGSSSFGILCLRCTGLLVKSCTIVAGSGAAGADGDDGEPGLPGSEGLSGESGTCGSGHGEGGSAGPSACTRHGGAGGRGGLEGANPGEDGQAAVGAGSGGGAGGSGGAGGDPGAPGQSGGNGHSGVAGVDGHGGVGGLVVSGRWTSEPGAPGSPGDHGYGGGGGGGGGGQGCTWCNTGGGNGGGGGGGGGCSGGGGAGGSGGGGSFGIFLVDSTGFEFVGNGIRTGTGGRGGHGGNGGQGGGGGRGGEGAAFCTGEIGAGGDGGAGGRGGGGGSGGGGAGGPSFGIYAVNTAVEIEGNDFEIGSGGSGGAGAGSPGESGAGGVIN